MNELLTTVEAARILKISPATLERWRTTGRGPTFRKLGNDLVRYATADLEAFLKRGKRTQTAKAAQAVENSG